MKKLFLSVVILATTVAFTSCQFDDSDIWDKFGEMEESIRDHEQRISALEELCKQMNTNIEALQTLVDALEKRDYVTNVSEVRNGGVVIGYTISFAYSESVTIYHGKDGKDGVDGYTPQIGVMKDTDNIYYWTLDGEWLLDADGNKIKAVGTDGADGKDGQDGTNGSDGKDGQDGTDGKDGADGVTPQLKIENDYWYVSYDNGATWVQLGKATGEDGTNGTDGKDGKDGDSFFQSVTQDEECVYLTLADGTIITLPKHKAEAANYKIYYTTSDGKKLFPNTTEPAIFGAILVSNNYEDGQGVLIFDDTITLIGSSAFENCTSLTSITIPDSVTSIGDATFYNCTSLASITIPDSVTSIGYRAFYNCTGELTVNCNIPSASSYEYGVFYGSKFTKVTIGNGVTSIGGYAFSSCVSLTSITIPDSVTSIEYAAFYNCTSLASITIPNSVTSIGGSAFSGCTGELIIDSKIIETNYDSDKYPASSDSNYGWLYNAKFTKLTIGNSVTSIGDATFYNCTSLTSITIPDSVTSIGEGAFSGCTSLTSITIPDSVTTIGGWAFSGCTSLTSVTIPDSVTSIGDAAFASCTSLTSVTIGNGVISIEYAAFYDCTSLTSVTIPNSVTSIGEGAFYDCTSLTSITIPDSVTSIEYAAFYNCTGELTVNCNIPSASSYEYGAFYGSKFTKVTIGNGVTSIGNCTFSYCSSLTSVTIPDSVTSIGSSAFVYCTSLTSVTIPDSVTSIGKGAFIGCTSLKEVYCKPTTPPAGDSYMFNYNASGRKIYVPRNSVEAYKAASYWSDYADYIFPDVTELTNNKIYYTSSDGQIVTPYKTDVFGANIVSNTYENGQGIITFDGDVTQIGDSAFTYCSSLTSVTILDSVTSIGEGAFYKCTSLTSVTIGNSVTSIGNDVFYRCTSLTSVTIPDSVTEIGSWAFYGCTSLKEVYCKPTTPPTAIAFVEFNNWDAFFENASGRTIYVPRNSVEAYKSAEYWSNYASDIEGYDF